MKDLIGQRIGQLVVLRNAERKGYVVCKCDCGKTVEVLKYNLTKKKNPTKSCGHYPRKISMVGVNAAHASLSETIKRYGTNVAMIANNKLRPNNHSGCTGVSYDAAGHRYVASIQCKRQFHYLGSYKTLDEAVQARKEAEDRLFAPIVDQWRSDMALRS